MASATANIATALEIEQMISEAQQIRLVAPTDGVAPVSSVIDDTLLFRKPEAKLRCFVDGGSWRSLPALGGVDYDPDPRADYDLILLPSDADLSAIGRPLGPDRNGLSALALAYTRDCSLAPLLRPDDPAVVAYPLLSGVSNAQDILEELTDAGLLRRRFFERLHICQHCDSSRLHAREVCLKCHSSHLTEQSLIHHYECGYQAVQTSFEAGNTYICPKCRRELRHYGVDYDKPGKVMCCNACGDTMTEPEVEFLCLDCHRSTSGDHARFRDWYEYDLLPDGIVAVKSGRLPTADSVDDAGRGRTLRDFKLLVTHSVSVAKRTGRPLCAARLTVDTTDLANKIGQRGAVSVCEMLRDVAVQSLREQDIAATLGDTVLVCMPETDEAAGKVAADHIQRAIFAAVRPKLKMTVEIFSAPQIDQFLKTVWQ